ncbi:hypothetical protein BLNAU_16935 [Blattamonas nauphoetae]|uniref:Uncharacterized protein n=1 Tax=Blattamonas nauphoetae TaxID=2049346 RepID=A0ABQ9XA82_9EUKA|nr:hypothetical protein BLNAU_16935 [Blattamonas nauphoetae]
MHLSPQPELLFMDMIDCLLALANPGTTRILCQPCDVTVETFQQALVDNFIHPLKPFFDIVFFEPDYMTTELLQSMFIGREPWEDEGEDVQKRHKQIMNRLNEEGFVDETELHVQSCGYDRFECGYVFVGALLIDLVSGNVPFEMDDEEDDDDDEDDDDEAEIDS